MREVRHTFQTSTLSSGIVRYITKMVQLLKRHGRRGKEIPVCRVGAHGGEEARSNWLADIGHVAFALTLNEIFWHLEGYWLGL